MRNREPRKAADTDVPRHASDAAFKRAHAATLRKYGRAFKLLAAYDRGEYALPSSSR
jgi:hypothetical protein